MIPKDITKSLAAATSQMLTRYATTIPDQNLNNLSFGDRDYNLQHVEDDPHVSSCIQQRKAGALSLEYEILYDETNKHLQPLFDSIVKSIDVPTTTNSFLDALLYGFTVLEIDWHYVTWNDKQVLLPKSLSGRPRNWFSFDSNKLLRLNNFEGTTLPKYKYLLIQHNATFANPYGKSLLSKCLWPVAFKKADMTFWMMFAEVYGMPKYVGKTAGGKGSPQFDELFESLEGLIQDGVMVIDETSSVDGLNPATTTNIDIYKNMIELCNSEISKIWLSETLTTEIGDTGSYAASNTHANVAKLVTKFDARLCEKGWKDLFKWIINFNFPDVNVPELILYEAQDVDRPLAEVVGILSAGNSGFRPKKEFFINRFGFKEDEFDVIDNSQQNPFMPFSKEEHTHDFVSDDAWDQILIDAIGDKLVENSSIANPLKNKLADFLNKHSDYESAIKDIAKLLPDMPSNEIEDILTNALFIADVTGRLSVKKEVENGQ